MSNLTSKTLSYFSKILSIAVFCLIFMGALVTSNDAGLAVPDWPNTFGHNMFLYPPSKWVGGIFYEHVHRLIASGVGLLTLILTIWILKKEPRKWLRITSLSALGAVILQGILGGLTVRYQLPVAISSFHAVLAQSFLCLTIFIAYALSEEFLKRKANQAGDKKIFRVGVFATILIFIQLIFGAVMRHSGAGLAVPDFPTVAGNWIPDLSTNTIETINSFRNSLNLYPISEWHIIIHLLHRYFAFCVIVGVIYLFISVGKSRYKDSIINKLTGLIFSVVIVQFLLGINVLFTIRSPIPTSLHVLCGALLLAFSFTLCLFAYPHSE
ncbi:MAG: COX15/CtaA family protein [Bdellovibrionales bacterium]|nr:COX15/CtaA family protein [Bdellovibrionales bacterium]